MANPELDDAVPYSFTMTKYTAFTSRVRADTYAFDAPEALPSFAFNASPKFSFGLELSTK